ncbi:MAG: alpha/beta hydrolase, partial [Acidimicrobiales bacterium]
TPVRCLPSAELDAHFAIDPTPDDEAEKAALIRSAQQFAAGCKERSGDLLAHVGTPEAARDMDLIRAAVGDEKLTYLGFSYGTSLGTSYAELFPDRVRALLLDGAVDPSLDTLELGRAQGESFDKAFDAFAADCGSKPACAWKPAGGPSKSAFLALSARVDAQPVAAGRRRLGPGEFLTGVAAFLYSRETWTPLAQGLAQVEAGNGAVILLGFDTLVERKPDGSFSNSQEANVSINCLDNPAPRDVAVYERESASAARTAPAFGPAVAWFGVLCAFWPVPTEGDAEPANAPGSPPILVVGTTNDPATPFIWAEALAGQLPQGRLLRHEGEGHTAYGDDECTTKIGDAYLLTLELPAGELRC